MARTILVVIGLFFFLLSPLLVIAADGDVFFEMDDTQALFTPKAKWTRASSAAAHNGDFYTARCSGDPAGTPTVEITFDSSSYGGITASLSEAYAVYIHNVSRPNATTSATYHIYDGTTEVGTCTINQKLLDGEWIYCDTASFTKGNPMVVKLGNNCETKKIVVADAVRIVKKPSVVTEETGTTAVGLGALLSNTTGYANTAAGYQALYSNTIGFGNTASGYQALYSSVGSVNTAIGYQALHSNTTADDNTAVGFAALYSNTTGYGNTASGGDALLSNSTGYWNTANGGSALQQNTTGYGNTASGVYALTNNTTGYNNTTSGLQALYYNATGYGNTAMGNGALFSNTTGSYNTAIGFYADTGSDGLTNAAAIGYNAKVDASNKVVIGNVSVTSVGGYADWTNFSDRRLKENIVYTGSLGLDFIEKLRTVSFTYRADEHKRRRDGLIAQDVAEVLADLGLEFSGLVIDEDKDGTMNLSYGEFVLPLINAVQELSKHNKKQVQRINELEDRLAKLEVMLGK